MVFQFVFGLGFTEHTQKYGYFGYFCFFQFVFGLGFTEYLVSQSVFGLGILFLFDYFCSQVGQVQRKEMRVIQSNAREGTIHNVSLD